MLNKWNISFVFVTIFAILFLGKAYSINTPSQTLSVPYSSSELETIKQYLFDNLTTEDHVIVKNSNGDNIRSIPGAILASPSNHGQTFIQDYQFHWTRDAAITINEIIYLYAHASSSEKQKLKKYLINYVNFERKAQSQISRPGEQTLGQPKFNIDATIWEGEWGRPQNDGPGLRATAMTAIANLFLQEGDEKYVRDNLIGVITTDLDYVAANWRASNFDLWEEVNDADHFFNKMVQRKGLIAGADFLKRMGDNQRAVTYLAVANEITESLQKHWSDGRGYFTETVNQQYFKGGGINTSIILGVLHGSLDDPNDLFAVNNERVMNTIYFIRNAFSGLYRVNIDHDLNPPVVGRYPNDVYDGYQNEYGNPWVLTTNALAQYYYTLANVYLKQGTIPITKGNILFFRQIDSLWGEKEEVVLRTANPEKFYAIIKGLIAQGDQALANVKRYAQCYDNRSCLHFAEQIDRTSGNQTSAKDLTWGYASILSAMQSRPYNFSM